LGYIDDLIRTEPAYFIGKGNTSPNGDWYITLRLPDGYPRVYEPILHKLKGIKKRYEEDLRCYRKEHIFPLEFELSMLKDQLDILAPEKDNQKDREYENYLIEIDRS